MPLYKKIKIFLQILGPLIFFYILFKIDFQALFEEIESIKWPWLILALGLMIFEIAIRSLRWRAILLSLDINISRLSSLNLYWLGVFLGAVTPGRLGELSKVYFLKNKGQSAFRSFFSVILDRTVDIFILLLLGFLIFLFFLKEIGVYMIFFGITFLLIIIFIFLLLDQRSFLYKIFSKLALKFFSIDLNNYDRFSLAKFRQGIKELKKKRLFSFFIYLIAGWFLYFLIKYLIALSLDLELSFISVAAISVLVAIVTALPISVAGLGTREAAVIYLFGLFNLNKETALSFSLLIFTVDILAVSFGLIPYFRESNLIDKIKQEN